MCRGFLCIDPGIYAGLQNIEGESTGIEDLIVEGTNVEFGTEGFLGAGA